MIITMHNITIKVRLEWNNLLYFYKFFALKCLSWNCSRGLFSLQRGGGSTRFLSRNPQETIYFIDPGRDGGKPPWPPPCSVYAAGVNWWIYWFWLILNSCLPSYSSWHCLLADLGMASITSKYLVKQTKIGQNTFQYKSEITVR